MSRFRITIDSNLTEVCLVSRAVRGICDCLGLDAVQASSVELCTVEAVTNVIKHSYLGAPGHQVSLEVSIKQDRLELDVRDQGVTMPEKNVKQLSSGSSVFEFDPADLDHVPEGGMGLEIIRQGMDKASYSSNAGTNSLKLTKFLKLTRSHA